MSGRTDTHISQDAFSSEGDKTQDYARMLASSLLVIALALASELVFATLQRLCAPAGSRRTRKDT